MGIHKRSCQSAMTPWHRLNVHAEAISQRRWYSQRFCLWLVQNCGCWILPAVALVLRNCFSASDSRTCHYSSPTFVTKSDWVPRVSLSFISRGSNRKMWQGGCMALICDFWCKHIPLTHSMNGVLPLTLSPAVSKPQGMNDCSLNQFEIPAINTSVATSIFFKTALNSRFSDAECFERMEGTFWSLDPII